MPRPKPVAPPVINLSSDAQVVEGDAGTAQMLFTVSLSHAADGPVSVSYSTLNGTTPPARIIRPPWAR